ncbi:Probable phospholipid ABC transporter-binding protein mlaB [Serratia rubidaea]|uniref:Probable phospholipid ABC transporter-binding protein mlaB n=1 Tax=Serratia rubidaea TaxID=61652 RepID=A0A3S4JTP5_SERRU|nr:Probable phospholipid ABC transporter-binding protein mlaB [Serratia rubidaea]
MAESLRFDDQPQTLVLHGDLDRETLLPLWRQRAELLKGKTAIDVAQLRRVDSSVWRCWCICAPNSCITAWN